MVEKFSLNIIAFVPLQKISWPCVYAELYSFPLIFLPIFLPVPHCLLTVLLYCLETSQGQSFNLGILFQSCLRYSGFFNFPYEFQNQFVKSQQTEVYRFDFSSLLKQGFSAINFPQVLLQQHLKRFCVFVFIQLKILSNFHSDFFFDSLGY